MRTLVAVALVLSFASIPARAEKPTSFDAFLASGASHALAVDENDLALAGARVAHREQRLGVPTFVWTRPAQFPAGSGSIDAIARGHLRRLAALYRLEPAAIDALPVRVSHDVGEGAILVSFTLAVDGVEAFRNRLVLVLDRDLSLVAVSGYLPPTTMAERARGASFFLRAEDAVASAFRQLTGVELAGDLLLPSEAEAPWLQFDLPRGSEELLGWSLLAPARAKRVFYTLPEGLVPAWYVELSVGPVEDGSGPYESFVVDARDGSLLMRNDLTAHASARYRVFADPVDLLPWDGPQGTAHSPHPAATPDGLLPVFAAAQDVELQNYPFSRNDPWLPEGATESVGNNVDAYADLVGPDGYQGGADLRAPASAPGEFVHEWDLEGMAPAEAAVTSLFYVTNFLHDWFYDVGFDEAAGNAQAVNFGRGGYAGDVMRAEARDYSGRNNANMSTPSDGASPRMQMYVYDAVPEIEVVAPSALAGSYASGRSSLGPASVDLIGELAYPSASPLGCNAFATAELAGKIALLDRGSCEYRVKILNAQGAGAVGVIIVNHSAGGAPQMGGSDPAILIPAQAVAQGLGDAWKAFLVANPGTPVQVHMRKGAHLDHDGSLDNAIVAHEWGHYISNRLVGDSNGLVNQQGRAMGEGWGDFHALLLQVRESDAALPGNDQFQATYASSGYAGSRYYFGSRRVPYSTSFAYNALTLRHIQDGVALPNTHPVNANGNANSQVHNAGEIWASMLWECYAALLREHTFADAQERMKRYLVAAYKATPVAPTYLEARDALLAVALASDPGDFVLLGKAFAKRGAGVGAVVPDRAASTFAGVVESFHDAGGLAVAMRLHDDGTGCDRDGMLDVGETGTLVVSVRNIGYEPLAPHVATVAELAGVASFPGGASLAVPALPPGQSVELTLPVALGASAAPFAALQIELQFDEPTLPAGNRAHVADFITSVDVRFGVSAVDEMDVATWQASGMGDWRWSDGVLQRQGLPSEGEGAVESPWIRVSAVEPLVATLVHRWSFESSNGAWYDGAVVEVSTDGVTWTDVSAFGVSPGYGGSVHVGSDNPLAGRQALVGESAGYPSWSSHVLDFGAAFAGQSAKFRFRQGSDLSVISTGWEIDSFAVSGASNLPFGARLPESSDGTVCNALPVADPGQGFVVPEGAYDPFGVFAPSLVPLDGSASFDPEGAPLTYAWTQVFGPPVMLHGPDAAVATFVTDVARDERYVFELQVADGVDASYPKQVEVVVQNVNRWPVARPTSPTRVAERTAEPVTLDGSASWDAEGAPLTYSWNQIEGPAVVLGDATLARPWFLVPEVPRDTRLGFELVVSDGIDLSVPEYTWVTIEHVDRPPEVDAGEDGQVPSRGVYTLHAIASDPDDDPIVLAWRQHSGPSVELIGKDTDAPSFTAPSLAFDTELEFRVRATAAGVLVNDAVTVLVRAETAPWVRLGPNFEVPGRTPVDLEATVTVPGDAPATYVWSVIAGPPVEFVSEGASATFVSPDVKEPEVITVQLEVTAGGRSGSDTIEVFVGADGPPVVEADADVVVASGADVSLSASASDPEGDALTWTWEQIAGPAVALAGADTSALHFTAPVLEVEARLTFAVIVEANGLSARDEVNVTVEAEPAGPSTTKRRKRDSGCSTAGGSGGGGLLVLAAFAALGVRRRRD